MVGTVLSRLRMLGSPSDSAKVRWHHTRRPHNPSLQEPTQTCPQQTTFDKEILCVGSGLNACQIISIFMEKKKLIWQID